MAEKAENVSGISAMGARATRVMNDNNLPMVTGLQTRGQAKVPLLVDQTNAAASRAKEKKLLATNVADNIGGNINIAYDLRDDMNAIEEERRYRAAVTFMEWIVQTYEKDAFSTHVMFEKHPFLKEMLTKTIDYWTGLVRKCAIAKILPRTMWDEEVENLLFKMYTMTAGERERFLYFINSNPFFTGNYPQPVPINRGPYSIRRVLDGFRGTTIDDPFERAVGGLGPFGNAISFTQTEPISSLMNIASI